MKPLHFCCSKNSCFPTLACSKSASDSLRYGAQSPGFQSGALRYGAVNLVVLHFGVESICSSFNWTPVWHPTLWCCQVSVLARTCPTLACSIGGPQWASKRWVSSLKNSTLQTQKRMYLQWGHTAEVTLRKLSDENTTLISAYLHVIECIMQGQWGLINQAAVTKQDQEQNQQEEQEARTRQQQLDAVCHNSD